MNDLYSTTLIAETENDKKDLDLKLGSRPDPTGGINMSGSYN